MARARRRAHRARFTAALGPTEAPAYATARKQSGQTDLGDQKQRIEEVDLIGKNALSHDRDQETGQNEEAEGRSGNGQHLAQRIMPGRYGAHRIEVEDVLGAVPRHERRSEPQREQQHWRDLNLKKAVHGIPTQVHADCFFRHEPRDEDDAEDERWHEAAQKQESHQAAAHRDADLAPGDGPDHVPCGRSAPFTGHGFPPSPRSRLLRGSDGRVPESAPPPRIRRRVARTA